MLEGVLEFFGKVNIVVLLDTIIGPGAGGLASWLLFIGCVMMGLTLTGLFVFGKEMFQVMLARIHNNMIGEIPLKTGKKILVEIERRAETFKMKFGSGDTTVEKEWKIVPDSFRSYESGVWYTILSPELPNSTSLDQLIQNTKDNKSDGIMTPDELDSAAKIHARRMALRMNDPTAVYKWIGIVAVLAVFGIIIYFLSQNATCPKFVIEGGGQVVQVAKNATGLIPGS